MSAQTAKDDDLVANAWGGGYLQAAERRAKWILAASCSVSLCALVAGWVLTESGPAFARTGVVLIVIALMFTSVSLLLNPLRPRSPRVGASPLDWLIEQRQLDIAFERSMRQIERRFLALEIVIVLIGTIVWGFGDWLKPTI